MSAKEKLIHEMENLPEETLKEVLDFLRFLREKRNENGMENAKASEGVLARDWLTAEEDQAWGNL
jgi:hypothetical protein